MRVDHTTTYIALEFQDAIQLVEELVTYKNLAASLDADAVEASMIHEHSLSFLCVLKLQGPVLSQLICLRILSYQIMEELIIIVIGIGNIKNL